MQASSVRTRGRNMGSCLPLASSHRQAPARSAPGGASLTNMAFRSSFAKFGSLHDGSPDGIFHEEEARLRVVEQGELLGGSQLVIERNEHAAAAEDGVGRNQPFRLIGHDDGGAVAGGKAGFLQGGGQGQRRIGELAIGEPGSLALAIGFDQADFVGPLFERRSQRRAERIVLGQVEHDWPWKPNDDSIARCVFWVDATSQSRFCSPRLQTRGISVQQLQGPAPTAST